MTLNEYMEVLQARLAEWEAAHPKPTWARTHFPPLLEWFIQPGDEELVELPPDPEPAPKRPRHPRTYRSAASLREERQRVHDELNALIEIDSEGDMAITNLSPYSRSRAARAAGRRRFAQLDRDLQRYTRLQRRLTYLDGRIARADRRETGRLAG